MLIMIDSLNWFIRIILYWFWSWWRSRSNRDSN